MRNHVIDEITKLAANDKRIMLVTADLGFNVVENFQESYPDRYINTGIAEQNMAAVSAGLALEGNMVFTYSIGNFPTLRCIEQIRNLICYHNANVKILAVGGGFAYGSLGMTHHATEDIAMMRSLPNMKVYVPADAVEAVACLRDLCKYDGPAYLRMARGREDNIHLSKEKIDINKCIALKSVSEDVNIFVAGTVAAEAVKLQKMIEEYGLGCGLYTVPRIKPIDYKSISEIASASKYILTLEEHNIIGGLGGSIAEVISDLPKHGVLMRYGLQDVYTSEVGNQDYLRDFYGLSAEKIFVDFKARVSK